MDPQNMQIVWIAAGVVAVILVAAIVTSYFSRKRHNALRAQFGSEYDRAVEETGSKARAERELVNREREVSRLDIQPLSASERDRFRSEWDTIEKRFLERPTTAVVQADELIDSIMRARGYRSGNFETRISELSVHYPRHVDGYREAHELIGRGGKTELTTEELRQAMLRCRQLVDQLLGGAEDVPREIVTERELDREVDLRDRPITPSDADRRLRR